MTALLADTILVGLAVGFTITQLLTAFVAPYPGHQPKVTYRITRPAFTGTGATR